MERQHGCAAIVTGYFADRFAVFPAKELRAQMFRKVISFTARFGQTVAFIEATRSGKSSLVNLIPRFYNVITVEILVDGVNVRDYEIHLLRDKISYVSQKAVLFSC